LFNALNGSTNSPPPVESELVVYAPLSPTSG
jgi:hypothetical protein